MASSAYESADPYPGTVQPWKSWRHHQHYRALLRTPRQRSLRLPAFTPALPDASIHELGLARVWLCDRYCGNQLLCTRQEDFQPSNAQGGLVRAFRTHGMGLTIDDLEISRPRREPNNNSIRVTFTMRPSCDNP